MLQDNVGEALPPEVPVTTETPPEATPVVDATPAAPPPVAPVAEPPKAPESVTPPAQPPAAVVAPEQPPSAPKSRTPEQEAEDTRQAQEFLTRYTGELESFYKLPEDLAGQMQTEPEVVLPKLAAKLHMAIENGIMQRVRQEMPAVFQTVQHVTEREAKSKEAFYSANPDLRQYESQVLATGKFFREANPNATPDEAIRRIGEITRAALGLPPLGAAQPPATPPAAPPQRPAAFRPAAPGASAPAPAPTTGGNLWEGLAEELLQDDR